jgi:chemotaxis protein MotB
MGLGENLAAIITAGDPGEGGVDMSFYASVSKFLVATGAVFLCAGCTGRKEVALAAKDDTIRKQESLIAQERADNDKLHDANKQLADQNNQLAEGNAKATQQLAAQEAANAQALADMKQKQAEQDALLRALNDKWKDGTGTVVRGENGAIHLTVAGSALFDSGKAELKGSAGSVLKEVCHIIKTKYPKNYIRIEGHTDSTPVVHSKEKFKDNMELSMARARSVYEYMVKDGIAGAKMYTAGYGEHQPLVHPEKTAADRAKNRRVEIVIMPENVKVEKDQLAQASAKAHK